MTALVASGLAIGAPALADPNNGTVQFTPGAGDFVGVGSDTTQFVMKDLADAFNNGLSTGRIGSWDACTYAANTTYPCTGATSTTAPITIRSNAVTGGTNSIARPNGSGAGKALLYSPSNPSVDFARSSSGLSTAETNAGLVAYPFAVDYLTTVVSASVASNAPTALSIGQVLGIYNGTFTNWAQLGGNNAPIHPYIPQTGSGTRTFFLAQLQAANGGVAPTLASNVVETQEHDPTAIKNDPDAVAPFSRGRADSTVRVENGWVAQRAVYNVVRGNASTALLNLFQQTSSNNSFLCSSAATSIIENDGFRQMALAGSGGSCGVATTASTSNFTVNPAGQSSGVPTTQSSLSVTGGVRVFGAGSNAVITVANGGTGFVSINGRGFTGVGAVSGTQASIAIPSSLPAGTYPITASYSGDATHLGSSNTGSLTVTRAGSAITGVKVKLAKAKKHHKATKYTATVRIAAAGVTPTGAVVIKKGAKTIGVGSLRNGVATISFKIAKLKKGKNKLTVSYVGDGNVVGVAKTITVKRKK
ncbi:substrate-binding domain-containing protein [Nocardioides mangrovicus]|uniref:substrate-binding domain-containing protein n=1 Tax=Nocardioides mangrovicus TaxID=2478913 RepID=UPI0013142330|nr:substrate-binding domain-containing protein [Nocardioides mangrovicus]